MFQRPDCLNFFPIEESASWSRGVDDRKILVVGFSREHMGAGLLGSSRTYTKYHNAISSGRTARSVQQLSFASVRITPWSLCFGAALDAFWHLALWFMIRCFTGCMCTNFASGRLCTDVLIVLDTGPLDHTRCSTQLRSYKYEILLCECDAVCLKGRPMGHRYHKGCASSIGRPLIYFFSILPSEYVVLSYLRSCKSHFPTNRIMNVNTSKGEMLELLR